MKICKLFLLLVSFSILNIFSQDAIADNREGAFVLSPGVGAYLFDTNRGIKNNAMYNLGLGYDFTNNWGIEALAGTLHTTTKGTIGEKSVVANLYAIDGIYHFTTNNPFVPYLLAGAGILDFSQNPNDQDTRANLNAGAGLEYFLGKSFAVHSDVRDVYTMANGKSDMLVNVGVRFLFGGQSKNMVSPLPMMQSEACCSKKVVVRFANKTTAIDPIYKTDLRQVVTCMQDNPNLKVNLDGYANSANNSSHNLTISQERAENVKRYLVEQAGIESSRITAQGFGTANPTLAAVSSHAANRESESVVISLFG